MTISLRAQIEEVTYELRQRDQVYARLVTSRKMRESVAKMHRDRMAAVLVTLEWLHANETAIREAIMARRGGGL